MHTPVRLRTANHLLYKRNSPRRIYLYFRALDFQLKYNKRRALCDTRPPRSGFVMGDSVRNERLHFFVEAARDIRHPPRHPVNHIEPHTSSALYMEHKIIQIRSAGKISPVPFADLNRSCIYKALIPSVFPMFICSKLCG